MIHPSVASIPEASLVQHLLSDRCWRSRVFGIRRIPDGEGSYVSSQASSAPTAPAFPETCSLLQFSAVKSRSNLAACSCTRTGKHGLCLAACAETAVIEAVGILWSDWGNPERIVEVLGAPGSNLSFQCLSFS